MFESRIAGFSRAAVALSIVALASVVVTTSAGDWPQFRGPQRDGISTETGLLKKWPESGPPVVWRTKLGQGFSTLSVVGKRIYTLYGRGKDEVAVALDTTTGAEVWNVRIDDKWIDQYGDGPRATPTVDGDVVYVLSARGRLYALATVDGKKIWKRDLQADYSAAPPRWGVSTQPLVEGDLLLVDVGGKGGSSIVAFDKKTGKEVWKSQNGKAGYSTPIAIEVGGLRQVVFFTGSTLLALAPEDGALLWKVPWKTSYDVNAATPIFIAPDRLFVSSGYDVGAAVYRIEVTESSATVHEIWKNREMKNKFSSSVLHDGYLYGFDETNLKCIDAADGKVRWRSRGLGFGSLIFADGRLIVLGDAGTLVLVEAIPDEYREKGRVELFEGKSWSMPVLSRGKLYVRNEKELVSLDLSAK
jgi:outer membrane protein assembly factor BamB